MGRQREILHEVRERRQVSGTRTTGGAKTFQPPVWRKPDGTPVSCRDKIKVLNENLDEIRQMCQDALEDGILMECDEAQLRRVLHDLVDSLENPYARPSRDQG